MARPSTRTPAPGVMKLTILVDRSLVIITIYVVCPKFLKKYINVSLFTPKLLPLGAGGHEIHNFLSPYPTDATHQIWFRFAH